MRQYQGMDLGLIAKYPFLQDAAAWVRSEGVTIEDILGDPTLAPARSRGLARAEAALGTGIPEVPLDTYEARVWEVLSYPYARILASAVGDPFLTRRYALAEAKLASSRLAREAPEVVRGIADELGLGPEAGPEAGRFTLHFTRYLQAASGLKGPTWRLVNQPLREGRVEVDLHRLIRLVEAVLHQRLEGELPLPLPDPLKAAVAERTRDLKAKVLEAKARNAPETEGPIDVSLFPPCIREILALQKAGENLSHEARFALAAFLHAIGMGSEDVLRVFAESPDFNPDLARYQVEHITGVASSTVYSPYSCDKMRSFGLCTRPDKLCAKDWVRHPLTYYRTMQREARRGGPAGAPEGTDGALAGEGVGKDAGDAEKPKEAGEGPGRGPNGGGGLEMGTRGAPGRGTEG